MGRMTQSSSSTDAAQSIMLYTVGIYCIATAMMKQAKRRGMGSALLSTHMTAVGPNPFYISRNTSEKQTHALRPWHSWVGQQPNDIQSVQTLSTEK